MQVTVGRKQLRALLDSPPPVRLVLGAHGGPPGAVSVLAPRVVASERTWPSDPTAATAGKAARVEPRKRRLPRFAVPPALCCSPAALQRKPDIKACAPASIQP